MKTSERTLSSVIFAALMPKGVFRLPRRTLPDDPERAAQLPRAFSLAFKAILVETDRAMMAAPMSCSPDRNFAEMMISHHFGAITMAQVELRYGTDPVLRRLAHQMIVTHQREIQLMRRHLNARQSGTAGIADINEEKGSWGTCRF